MTGFLIIYGIGFVVALALAWSQVGKEPTAHGQEILIGFGFIAAVFWPVALLLVVVAWLAHLTGWFE